MNTYNENLQSAVISSLQAQGLDQKTVQSQMNASMFTLYYAEGATVTGREKLATALLEMGDTAITKSAAVDNTNLSNNLLSSATQGNQYASQSISNTAIAAANVQVAANAVVKLSSDIGSIFSIVSSANFGSEIYTQVKEARHIMDNTAYHAELASQHAMEASIKASAVSASTVLDRAKGTNGQMKNLKKVLSADFDNAAQLVAADNAMLATKSAAEKVAEGDFEDISVDYKASTSAYKSLNRGLNLNLRVPAKDISATSFTVKFRAIRSPFENDKAVANYPVDKYYLMLVKESKQTTFSLSQAEYVLENQQERLVPVVLAQAATGDNAAPPSTTAAPTDTSKKSSGSQNISMVVNINSVDDGNGNTYVLQDTDGDTITTGTNYVVFVMAVYVDEYKRKVNVFDDFLSAPSQYFVLTNVLKPAENLAVKPSATGNTLTVTFNTNDNPNYKVQYRCMFLLMSNPLITAGLVTQNSVDAIRQDIEKLEEIAEQFDPKIEELQANILQLQQNLVTGATDTSKTDVQNQQAELSKLFTDRQKAIDNLAKEGVAPSKIGFIFNQDIAEHIPAANYIVAMLTLQPPAGATSAAPAEGSTPAGATEQPSPVPQLLWQAVIGPDTTDNFGNPLQPSLQYIPVVLTMSAEEEANMPRFTNNITDFENSAPFTPPSPTTTTNTNK